MEVFELERAGKLEDGFRLLEILANNNDPMALIELGSRYIVPDHNSSPTLPLLSDPEKVNMLIQKGKEALEAFASKGDGEAMRMLGYYYLGHLGSCHIDRQKAEVHLINAYQIGCHFAAKDLHCFYLHSDKEKSKWYYQEAERHHCRVVYYEEFES